MDELIQKYLDGDLSDEEAAEFSRALADDPELESELRAFERSLALAAARADRDPSPAFTDSVMERVAASGAVHRKRDARVPRGAAVLGTWRPRLAMAAGVVVVFALGYLAASQRGPRESPTTIESVSTGAHSVQVAAAPTSAPASLRLARLVYVPQDEDVDRVTVAGSFNGWDPEGMELRKEGGAWVVQLVLPPQTYEYMFVENGEEWVTDPLAFQTRDDGFGRKNAVLDLTL
jgi:anti-sigma factor RsiW